jgi:DNA-directed RNA polymerase subunit RPC12/RpoP
MKQFTDLKTGELSMSKHLSIRTGIVGILVGVFLIIVASIIKERAMDTLFWIVIICGLIIFVSGICSLFFIKTQRVDYQCPNCNAIVSPGIFRYGMGAHAGKKTYMKCPNCKKRYWFEEVSGRKMKHAES